MATVQAEMTQIWQVLIKPNYPTPTNLDNAINLSSWTTSTVDDPLANLLAQMFINIRNPKSVGWNSEMTAAQKKSLYDEVDAMLTQIKATVDTIQSAVHAAYLALP